MSRAKHKALIIGLGNIGMGYDYALSHHDYILTHAQALHSDRNYELLGGVDISSKKKSDFTKKFNLPSFSKINSEVISLDPDIVSISVNTEFHLDVLKEVMGSLSPKLVVLEKPISVFKNEIKLILEIVQSEGIALVINYFREFEPEHKRLLKKINDNELGFPLKIIVWYSKGLLNNGSHFVQFLSNFMGKVKNFKIIENNETQHINDFEPSLKISYEKGDAFFVPAYQENSSFNEMEIVGPKGKVKYYNSGRYYQQWNLVKDPVFNDNSILEAKPSITQTKFNHYQKFVYNNIHDYLKNKNDLDISFAECVENNHLLIQIKKELSNWKKS